jgi:hypothetical protein
MPRRSAVSRPLGFTARVTDGSPSDQPSSITLEKPSDGRRVDDEPVFGHAALGLRVRQRPVELHVWQAFEGLPEPRGSTPH